MARGMIGIERETLLSPIRKNLDQFAAFQERVETKLDGLRYAMACNAGGEFGRKIVHDETAGYLDLYDLPGAMELPGKGTPGNGVTEQNAFVPHQIVRVPWPTAAREVGGRGTGKDARFQKPARDQAGWLRLPRT